ncbi:MAG: cysteine hydrolase [Lachnospiraceae bacterium]|nr:cysteine hydrolase [Lachnospiraceae bacterium]
MKEILVAVDLQNDFIDEALGTPEAVAIVDNAVEKILSYRGKKVYATMDTHGENYMETAEGRHLPVPHCIRGTHGWLLNDRIAAALGEVGAEIVEKPTFGSLDLAEKITEYADGENVNVELIGLCTDICVISNALMIKANLYESEVSVDPACCAGVTPATHDAALTTMQMCQINIA